jgi:hypothetical protein
MVGCASTLTPAKFLAQNAARFFYHAKKPSSTAGMSCAIGAKMEYF